MVVLCEELYQEEDSFKSGKLRVAASAKLGLGSQTNPFSMATSSPLFSRWTRRTLQFSHRHVFTEIRMQVLLHRGAFRLTVDEPTMKVKNGSENDGKYVHASCRQSSALKTPVDSTLHVLQVICAYMRVKTSIHVTLSGCGRTSWPTSISIQSGQTFKTAGA